MIRAKFVEVMAHRLMEEARACEGEPHEEALWEAARSLFHLLHTMGEGVEEAADLPPREVLYR